MHPKWIEYLFLSLIQQKNLLHANQPLFSYLQRHDYNQVSKPFYKTLDIFIEHYYRLYMSEYFVHEMLILVIKAIFNTYVRTHFILHLYMLATYVYSNV